MKNLPSLLKSFLTMIQCLFLQDDGLIFTFNNLKFVTDLYADIYTYSFRVALSKSVF